MASAAHQLTPKKAVWVRPLPLFLLAVMGALILFLGITGSRIVRAAAEVPYRKADVIVIFGAAQMRVVLRRCTARVLTTAMSSSRRKWLRL